MSRITTFLCIFCILICSLVSAAPGQETFIYDARGRLAQVTFADGTIVEYKYDAAGNRTSSGKPAAKGTFSYQSGSHSSRGNTGNVVTATIMNTGAASITGITYTCSGSFYTLGGSPTTLAAGATAAFQCQAPTSGGYSVVFTFNSATATTSPYATPSF